jgi:hypothetical protein
MAYLCSFFLVLLGDRCASLLPPPGTVTWAKGYPQAVPKTGQALVKGVARPSRGYTLRSATVRYWESGGELRTATVALRPDGTFGPVAVPGLAPGTTYNMTVEVIETRPGEEEALMTAPVRVKAR